MSETPLDIINQQGAQIAELEDEVVRLKREMEHAQGQARAAWAKWHAQTDLLHDLASFALAAWRVMQLPSAEKLAADQLMAEREHDR